MLTERIVIFVMCLLLISLMPLFAPVAGRPGVREGVSLKQQNTGRLLNLLLSVSAVQQLT